MCTAADEQLVFGPMAEQIISERPTAITTSSPGGVDLMTFAMSTSMTLCRASKKRLKKETHVHQGGSPWFTLFGTIGSAPILRRSPSDPEVEPGEFKGAEG